MQTQELTRKSEMAWCVEWPDPHQRLGKQRGLGPKMRQQGVSKSLNWSCPLKGMEHLIMPLLSPERHLRWLRVFEPLMIITGIVQPLATLPSISKLYFTHTQHASGQSLTTWSIFSVASLLWVTYGLLNRKAAIYVGNIIGLVMNLLMVNG